MMSFAPLPINGAMGSHLARTMADFSTFQPIQLKGMVTQGPLSPPSEVGGIQSFQSVLGNTFQQLNQTVQAPEALMHQAMSGGPADIHDVVMASTQAELAVSLTTNAMGKIIQAYERISQIQV